MEKSSQRTGRKTRSRDGSGMWTYRWDRAFWRLVRRLEQFGRFTWIEIFCWTRHRYPLGSSFLSLGALPPGVLSPRWTFDLSLIVHPSSHQPAFFLLPIRCPISCHLHARTLHFEGGTGRLLFFPTQVIRYTLYFVPSSRIVPSSYTVIVDTDTQFRPRVWALLQLRLT